MGENTFFFLNIVGLGALGYSIYLSFTTDHWYAFIVGLVTVYLIGKFLDPRKK